MCCFHPVEGNKKLNLKVTLPQVVNSFSPCVCIYICIWNILIILLNFLFHGAISVASPRHCWKSLILTQNKWSTYQGLSSRAGRAVPQYFTLTPESLLHGLLLVPVSHGSRTGPSCGLLCLKAVPLASALPAILMKDLLFLLLAFIFLAEAGLRSCALLGLMKVHKDELEIWLPHLGGAEAPSLGAKGT